MPHPTDRVPPWTKRRSSTITAPATRRNALARGTSRIEFVRTKELLQRFLPSPPATILDVGGGPGAYATWLADLGYRVQLVCASARPALPPHRAGGRVQALMEAARVVRPGGIVAAAAISRFASLLDGLVDGFLGDPVFDAIVERDLREGPAGGPTAPGADAARRSRRRAGADPPGSQRPPAGHRAAATCGVRTKRCTGGRGNFRDTLDRGRPLWEPTRLSRPRVPGKEEACPQSSKSAARRCGRRSTRSCSRRPAGSAGRSKASP
jgi:hypothetical protein